MLRLYIITGLELPYFANEYAPLFLVTSLISLSFLSLSDKYDKLDKVPFLLCTFDTVVGLQLEC